MAQYGVKFKKSRRKRKYVGGGRHKTKQRGTDQNGSKKQIKREAYYNRFKGTVCNYKMIEIE